MAGSLSAQDLAMIRAVQNEYYPDTCTILSPGTARTSGGGYTDAWGTAASNVACRFRVIQAGGEARHGYSLRPETGYVLTLASTITLTTAYRVVVGSTTYNVESVNSDENWKTCIRATLIPVTTRAG